MRRVGLLARRPRQRLFEIFRVLFDTHGAFVHVARGLSGFDDQFRSVRYYLADALDDGFCGALCEELNAYLGTDLGHCRSIAAHHLLLLKSGSISPVLSVFAGHSSEMPFYSK